MVKKFFQDTLQDKKANCIIGAPAKTDDPTSCDACASPSEPCQLQVNFVSVSSLSTELRWTEQARHRCGGRKQTVLRRSGDGMPLKKSFHETSTDLHPQVSPRQSPRHANRWQQRKASSRKGRRPRARTDSKFFPVSLPRATLHTISRRSFKILLGVGA